MSAVRDKRAGVLSTTEGWYEKKEEGNKELVAVVSIGTANKGGASIDYVSKHGRGLDVTSIQVT